jgi:hypothetical protein
VSAKEQITKLETLLARVSSRANEPRVAHARPQAPAHIQAAAPAVVVAPPPALVAKAPPIVVAMNEPDIDVVQEAAEVPVAAKSDARLIAAKAVEPLDLESTSDTSETLLEAHLESIPVEDVGPELEVAEEEDPAPSSSRRPISPPADELAETAFGADDLAEPPRHTPPPESGRLPAAPELAPVIDADDEAQDITGVHHSTAERPVTRDADVLARSGEHEGLSSSAPDEVTPPPALASRVALTPHVARPERTASAAVVDTIGEAMAFSPATFGDLLDATLSL